MTDKRKAGAKRTRHAAPRTGSKRRGAAPAGRIAVRRETAAPRRVAMDEHAVQVREQIDAALAEAQRMREGIEERIEQRMHAPGGEASAVPVTPPVRVGRGLTGMPVAPRGRAARGPHAPRTTK